MSLESTSKYLKPSFAVLGHIPGFALLSSKGKDSCLPLCFQRHLSTWVQGLLFWHDSCRIERSRHKSGVLRTCVIVCCGRSPYFLAGNIRKDYFPPALVVMAPRNIRFTKNY